METRPQTLPLVIPPKYSYQGVIDAIVEAAGLWVLIDPSTLPGNSHTSKQARLLGAAARRSIRITTSFKHGGGACYARLVTEASTAPQALYRLVAQ
jgi:hypothetical protein